MKSLEERAMERMATKDYSEMVTMPKQLFADSLEAVMQSGELAILVTDLRTQLTAANARADRLQIGFDELLTVGTVLGEKLTAANARADALEIQLTSTKAELQNCTNFNKAYYDRAILAEEKELKETARADALRDALLVMVASEVSYMCINNLGDPEQLDRIKTARKALEDKPHE